MELKKDINTVLRIFKKWDFMDIRTFVKEKKEPDKTVRYKVERDKYPFMVLGKRVYLPGKIINKK